MKTILCSCSVAKLCPTLCDLINCSLPGFLVLDCLPEFVQTQIHWVGNAIQPSYPLSPPSSLAFNLSQPQGLFQWIGSSHTVAKVWEFQLQHQSFQWIFRVFPLGLTGLILLFKGLSRVFSNTTVQKHQFFSTQSSLQSNSHLYLTTEKTTALTRQTFVGKLMSLLFNTLSRFVIAFVPRSKHLLILWLQSPSTVILESRK